MIVKEGRNKILKAIQEGTAITFPKVILSYNDALTVAETSGITSGAGEYEIASPTIEFQYPGVNEETDDPRIKVTIDTSEMEQEEVAKISSIKLVGQIGEGQEAEQFLFSRIVFQEYTKSSNSNYKFIYYIYF